MVPRQRVPGGSLVELATYIEPDFVWKIPSMSPVSCSCNLTTTSGSTPHRGGLNFPQNWEDDHEDLNRPGAFVAFRMRRTDARAFSPAGFCSIDRPDQDRRDRRGILGGGRFADQSRRHGRGRHQCPRRRQRPQDRSHHLRQPLVRLGRGPRLPARGEPGQSGRGDRQLYQRSRPGARALVGASAHAVHHAGRRQQSDLQGRPRRLRPLQIHLSRLADVRLHRASDLRLHQRDAGRSFPSEDRG